MSRLCSPVRRFLSGCNCRTVFRCYSSVVQNLCNCVRGMYFLKEANKYHLFLIYTKFYVYCIIRESYHIPSHVGRFPEVFVLEQDISWQHFQNCGLSKSFPEVFFFPKTSRCVYEWWYIFVITVILNNFLFNVPFVSKHIYDIGNTYDRAPGDGTGGTLKRLVTRASILVYQQVNTANDLFLSYKNIQIIHFVFF